LWNGHAGFFGIRRRRSQDTEGFEKVMPRVA